jgi:hypothetical protein
MAVETSNGSSETPMDSNGNSCGRYEAFAPSVDFTPMMTIRLFAGSKAQRTSPGVLATLLALVLRDGVLGFYPGFWHIYAAALIQALLGRLIHNRSGGGAIAAAALISCLSFFLITNFMFWATGRFYPHAAAGLSACYAAGLPFYQNQVLGDAFYRVAISGSYTAISHFFQSQRQAS